MTYAPSVSKPALHLNDRYLLLLSGVLMGYAFVGKGFAYIGFPPLFIGEIVLLTGAVVLLRTGCLIAALTTLPSLLLAAIMIWVMLRTLPFVDAYGFDALRDSAVIMYGGFAFIVAALLLEDSRRVNTILRYYEMFLSIFIPVIPFVYVLSRYLPDHVPHLPGTNIPLVLVKSGEVAVHLVGASVFVLAGFCKLGPLRIILVLATVTSVISTGRGAMLAFVVPIVFAMLLLGKAHQLVVALVAALVIFSSAYAIETALVDNREAKSSDDRSLSVHQIVENASSIFGQSGEQTEGTKKWRLEWWDIIIKDTALGPHFWTGRGFGLNLGDADGFRDGDHPDLPPLRSPHNVQMTMLARAGIPGITLWAAFLASWFGTMMHTMWTARRRGQKEWANLFVFVGCYALSCIINATFDVALEGPVQGIWFWCLIGFGIGAVMVYRFQPSDVSEQ
jgi:hypothetical protein